MRLPPKRYLVSGLTAVLLVLLTVFAVRATLSGSAGGCAAPQGFDPNAPPQGLPTPNAKQLVNRATLDYQLSLTPPAPAPTTEIDLPPGDAPGEERTYYPEWEMYLTDAQATMQPQMSGGTEWLDIRPPEAGGSVGVQAAQPDIPPC